MAEFWFNTKEKNAVDVALGVRYLPAMPSTTLTWHLADFGLSVQFDSIESISVQFNSVSSFVKQDTRHPFE